MNKKKLLEKLISIGIIHKQPVVLRSGKVAEFYCDIKKAFGESEILNGLADEIGKLLPKNTTVIAVSGYGGLPLGAVICSRHNKKLCAVRSKEKDHGKGGLIDGYVPNKKDKVVIVDDVLTSGSSVREVIESLKSIGIKAERAVVVVKRGDPVLKIKYDFVFEIGEIIKVGEQVVTH